MYIKKVNRQEAIGKSLGSRNNKQEARIKMVVFLVSCFLFLSSLEMNAQCAMCRAVLETEEGGVKAEAVNDGIMYLMIFPYLLVGILGYVIYKMKTKKKPEN